MEALLQVIEEALEASGYSVMKIDDAELGVETEDGHQFFVQVDRA